jgi:hypothetical protein
VKIAGKTLLHKEFGGISAPSAAVLRELRDLRSVRRNQNPKTRIPLKTAAGISTAVERAVALFPRFPCVRVKYPFPERSFLRETLWGPSLGRLFF